MRSASRTLSRLGGLRSKDFTGGRLTQQRCTLLAALHLANHALTLALLAFGKHVAAAGERVVAIAEIDAHRRAFQLVALAEEVFEITAIGRRNVLGAAAVNHDGRRIGAPRVGKTQFGRMPAYQRRLVAF